MNLQSTSSLLKKLADKKYRDAFVASRISQTIAIQSRVLRQQAGLSQDELAIQLGTSQNAVSRIESPTYGKASISTLRKLASFFDVALVVRFAAFSEIANWAQNISPSSIRVPSFKADVMLSELGQQCPSGLTSASELHDATTASDDSGSRRLAGVFPDCEPSSINTAAYLPARKPAASTGTLGRHMTNAGIHPLRTGITAT